MTRHRSVEPAAPERAAKVTAARNWLVALGLGAAVLVGASLLFAPSGPTASEAAPGPHIQLYATDLQGEVHQPLPAPETFSHGADVAGCDTNYGTGRECVPVNFPPGVRETAAGKCAWLKKEKFGPLVVQRKDVQGLVPIAGPRAPDGKSYACPRELGTR